jgi:ClpP class serine protease
MIWLINKDVLKAMESGAASVSASERLAYIREREPSAAENLRIYNEAGDRAQIVVEGVLTDKPDFLAMLFGGGNTTYGDIIAAIDAAERDPNIREIYMYIDSPGGTVAGMFDAMESMRTAQKPITVIGRNTVASAAYGLASQADRILSSNRATRFGSVGVAVEMHVSDERVTVTSTNAPRKRPDVRTDEGKQMVREELDATEALFVESIAQGRGIEKEKVLSDFGEGGMLLAEEAQKRGMIDGLQEPSSNVSQTTASSGGNKVEAINMDLNTLKAQHPDVFAEAVKLGEDKERARASDHLKLGAACGDIQIAISAIKDGKELSACQADYMAASMNRKDRENAQADDESVKAGAKNTPSEEPTGSEDKRGEEVAALVEQLTGVTQEA